MNTASNHYASASFFNCNMSRPHLQVLAAEKLQQARKEILHNRDYILQFGGATSLTEERFDELLRFLHKATRSGARTYLVDIPAAARRALALDHGHLNYAILVNVS